jgi:fatty acid desaturase
MNRVIGLIRALIRLWFRRRDGRLARVLALAGTPGVLDACFRANAGPLVLAAVWLPRDLAREFTVAHGLGRVTDAFEDLDDRGQLPAWAAYLRDGGEPPDGTSLIAVTAREQFDLVLVRDMPVLRRALWDLPPPARHRVLRWIEDLCEAKGRGREAGTRRYGGAVLGRTVQYVMEALDVGLGEEAQHAVGAALQRVNDYRDAAIDRRDPGTSVEQQRNECLRDIAMESPHIAPIVDSMVRCTVPGARAAVALLMSSTTNYLLEQVGHPGLASNPLWMAWRAEGSPDGLIEVHETIVLAVVRAGERAITRGDPRAAELEPLQFGRNGVALWRVERAALADLPATDEAERLRATAWMLRLTALLGTAGRKAGNNGPRARAAVLMSDFASLQAAALVGAGGADALEAFADHMQRDALEQNLDAPDEISLLSFLLSARARIADLPTEHAHWMALGRQSQRLRVNNRFLDWGQGVAERVLFLRHGADCGPLLHIAIYFALLIGLRFGGESLPAVVWGGLWLVLTMLSFSLTIGINHLHAHRAMFRARLPNQVVEVLLAVPCLLTSAEMTIFHVRHHHQANDGPEDAASTRPYRTRLGAIYYYVAYPFWVRRYVWWSFITGRHGARRLLPRYAVHLGICGGLLWALFAGQPDLFLWLWVLPMMITWFNSGYFSWLTHAPAPSSAHGGSDSLNSCNNWMNLFVFNQGYHVIHHRYPGIHWSEIPDHFGLMEQVEDSLITNYWVTLDSAWRLLLGVDAFHDERAGAAWKTRFRARRGRHRLVGLDYFGWV